MLGEGKQIADVCRTLQITEATDYRWRNQFGGLNADGAKWLKDLERELHPERLLAEAELEKAALQVRHRRDTLRSPVRLVGQR
ncbi:hypothetical protein EBN03_15510 [Nocardia stercoris]|uniref:Transposase n=1 Tax=Nocardia stercoris TaxID=2483361 RepID=A0A3M2L3S4_9NOCA|nr:hypothetical protein EBN03_15510 [Nocardia stercoris]